MFPLHILLQSVNAMPILALAIMVMVDSDAYQSSGGYVDLANREAKAAMNLKALATIDSVDSDASAMVVSDASTAGYSKSTSYG